MLESWQHCHRLPITPRFFSPPMWRPRRLFHCLTSLTRRFSLPPPPHLRLPSLSSSRLLESVRVASTSARAMRPALCRARFSTSVQGGGPQPATSPPSFHSSTPPIQSSALSSSSSSSTPNPFCRIRLTLAVAHNPRPRPPAVYPRRRRPQ